MCNYDEPQKGENQIGWMSIFNAEAEAQAIIETIKITRR
jgi:hypothetical protein